MAIPAPRTDRRIWTGRAANTYSLQCHPEFAPEYAAALIELRRNSLLSAELADRALDTLREPNDRALVGRWLARFLRSNVRA